MFVRSSTSLGRDPSRTNDMGSPKQDLDSVWRTCAINATSSSRSKERRTNATNATHASKPYRIRVSGCGVLVGQMPQTPHRLHQTPHSSCVTSWPRLCHSAFLQGSDRHLHLRGETVLQRQRTPPRLRDRKSVLPSGQSLVTSADRVSGTESLQSTGIPSMGSL